MKLIDYFKCHIEPSDKRDREILIGLRAGLNKY